MNNEKETRDLILQFYLDNPKTELTAAEIANKFNFKQELPQSERGEIVRSIKKRAVKKQGDWIPRSRWEIQKKGGEIATLNSWRAPETAVLDKWKDFKEDLIDALKSVDKSFLEEPDYKAGECLAELNIFDYHLGKEDGRSLDQQCTDFLNATKILHQKVRGFQVDRFLFVLGNDLFHVDTAHNTTTKGTNVAHNAEWDVIYSKGIVALIQSIQYLLKYAPVDIVAVQGNHDYVFTFTAAELLKHYFAGEKNVKVYNDTDSSRKYYKYGKCLLGYTHGNQEKQQDLPLIMAVENPEAFAKCTYRYWRVGHLHHSIVKEYQGIEVETLASLSPVDRWHKVNGYLSKPKAQVTIFNKETGKEGQFIFNNY